ncbi:hypothetical protein ACJX0J_038817, partial [Zea mays]
AVPIDGMNCAPFCDKQNVQNVAGMQEGGFYLLARAGHAKLSIDCVLLGGHPWGGGDSKVEGIFFKKNLPTA